MPEPIQSVAYKIGDKPFHALTAGAPDRPMILFLHGFPEYSGAWREVMELLAARFFCVAPDQRGYARSWRPQEVSAYDASALVQDALATIDHFGGPRRQVILVGHDWGASIAYALAMRAAARVSRLVVFNGVHPAPFQAALAAGGAQSRASAYITWLRQPGAAEALAADDFARLFTFFGAGMDMRWLTEARCADYKRAWGGVEGLRAMINWYRASRLLVAAPGQPIPPEDLPRWPPQRLRIAMPHLLVWGMADQALLVQSRAGLAEYCDDFSLQEVLDCDHWIIHQRPRLAAEAIARFAAS